MEDLTSVLPQGAQSVAEQAAALMNQAELNAQITRGPWGKSTLISQATTPRDVFVAPLQLTLRAGVAYLFGDPSASPLMVMDPADPEPRAMAGENTPTLNQVLAALAFDALPKSEIRSPVSQELYAIIQGVHTPPTTLSPAAISPSPDLDTLIVGDLANVMADRQYFNPLATTSNASAYAKTIAGAQRKMLIYPTTVGATEGVTPLSDMDFLVYQQIFSYFLDTDEDCVNLTVYQIARDVWGAYAKSPAQLEAVKSALERLPGYRMYYEIPDRDGSKTIVDCIMLNVTWLEFRSRSGNVTDAVCIYRPDSDITSNGKYLRSESKQFMEEATKAGKRMSTQRLTIIRRLEARVCSFKLSSTILYDWLFQPLHLDGKDRQKQRKRYIAFVHDVLDAITQPRGSYLTSWEETGQGVTIYRSGQHSHGQTRRPQRRRPKLPSPNQEDCPSDAKEPTE